MIKLERGLKPAVLAANEERWTREFVEYRPPPRMPASIRYRYRHPDIKAALVRSAHGKCMYCESPVTRTHPGEIEHIRPSSRRPDLVAAWENLGFVCHDCNWRKSDYYEETPLGDEEAYRHHPRAIASDGEDHKRARAREALRDIAPAREAGRSPFARLWPWSAR